VFALRVVEKRDVVAHILARVFAGFDVLRRMRSRLSRLKTFSTTALAIGLEPMAPTGSIPAVRSAAHAGSQIMLLKELLPRVTGELGPLIGVQIDLGLWLATPAAISRAWSGRAVQARPCIDQPMTRRENRSITTARYRNPSWVQITPINNLCDRVAPKRVCKPILLTHPVSLLASKITKQGVCKSSRGYSSTLIRHRH
jgi:hypothetical protein